MGKKKSPLNILFLCYMLCYFFINLLTLEQFPLVHSDEAWLAGLSAAYSQAKSPLVTESFFDLFPRQAHAIKWLFHGIQAGWISVFGYTLFTIRFLSLTVGMSSLIILFQYLKNHHSKVTAFLVTLAISLHPQLLLVFRMGRQEVFLIFFLICALWLLDYQKIKSIYLTSLILFVSIGFHPNAFIIACMIFGVITVQVLKKTRPRHHLTLFVFLTLTSGALYVALSLFANPQFIADYWTYGQTHLVDAPAFSRILHAYEYIYKLYNGISGTYPLVEMRPTLILGVCVLLLGLVGLSFRPKALLDTSFYELYATLLAFLLGTFIIGRYNPLAIAFIIIPLYLITASLTPILNKRQLMMYITIFALSIASLSTTLANFSLGDYQHYEKNIRSHLSEDAIILGNLSSGFALNTFEFYDIRNLAYLGDQSLESYLFDRKINTIIYYEEYDYIHRNPMWQILYGNDEPYYDDLQELILKKGTPIHTFSDAYYGTRIVKYQGDYPWEIIIYEIKWH